MKISRLAVAFTGLMLTSSHAQLPSGMNAPGGAAPLTLVQTLQQSLATMQGQIAGLLSGTTTPSTGTTGTGTTTAGNLPSFTLRGDGVMTGGGNTPLVLTSNFTSGDDISAAVTPIASPAGPATYTLHASFNIPGGGSISAGLVLMHSGQPGITALGILGNSTLAHLVYSNATTYSTGFSSPKEVTFTANVQLDGWLRTVNDGTNITLWYSPSGAASSFVQVGQPQTIAQMGTPDQIGIYVDAVSGGSGTQAFTLDDMAVVTTTDPQIVASAATAGTGGTGGGSTVTAGLQTSTYQGVLHQIDAAQPVVSTATTANGGIQIDGANGGIANIVDTASGEVLDHGYGEALYVASGGLNNGPFIRSAPNNYHNGYDGIRFPVADVDPLMGPSGNPWTATFVMRQTSGGGNDLIKLSAGSTSFVLDIGGVTTDGALYASQSNGSAQVGEGTSALSALNNWQIVTLELDGSTINVYRQGTRTMQSVAGASATLGNFGTGQGTYFAILNNANVDLAYAVIANGGASNAEMNTENARLATKYGITGVATVTQGPSSHLAPLPLPAVDQTLGYLTTPIFPTSNTLPTIAGSVPGNGITLASSATPIFDMRFGSNNAGANITDSATFRTHIYTNYAEGNLNNVIGSPNDTGQGNNNTFNAVARTYPVGNANDLIPVKADGLHVDAICANNHTDCSPGRVYGGFFRLPLNFLPGQTFAFDYIPATAYTSWVPSWFFTGFQNTPYPGTDPYSGNAAGSYFGGSPSFEIDWNDNEGRHDAGGCVAGGQINFGTPNIYGVTWNKSPYMVYSESANGFTSKGPVGQSTSNAFLCEEGYTAGTVRHMVYNWGTDNLLTILVNGRAVAQAYMEYPQTGTVTLAGGGQQQLGMTWLVGNQAIPSFDSPNTAVENEGLGEGGWGETILRMAAWNGNIANLPSYFHGTNAVH